MPELEAFACGDTVQDVARVLRGVPSERRAFPATAFLWTDGERRVLVDTGYAPLPWRAGPAAWIYRRLLPPRVPTGATIAEQLDPASVTHVVLTHLHPDHVGGARFFPHATFVLTAGMLATLARPRLRDAVLRRLLPPWLAEPHRSGAERIVVSRFDDPRHGLATADLFGDGSVRIVDLPGHTRGHAGVLLEDRVLIAGDAAWGRDLLGREHRMRLLPRRIADDAEALAATADRLLGAERAGVRLLFSHDAHPTGTDLR